MASIVLWKDCAKGVSEWRTILRSPTGSMRCTRRHHQLMSYLPRAFTDRSPIQIRGACAEVELCLFLSGSSIGRLNFVTYDLLARRMLFEASDIRGTRPKRSVGDQIR